MNANLQVSQLFVDELARSGLREVCIAPGSRSTPLTLAFYNQPGIKVFMHLDERSAAFFALGLALANDRPVALVCTSGSAAANFFPAVVEARMARVPLLVLTADRPPELRGSGANQTIDQIKLYGDQVLLSADLPVPDQNTPELTLRHVRTLAARAFATANGLEKGPVHLNFPFRKPLEPVPGEPMPVAGEPDRPPLAVIEHGLLLPTPEQLERLAGMITAQPHGIIVCGPRTPGGRFPEALVRLAQVAGYPILADPLSGLRYGPHTASGHVLGAQDALLSAGNAPWDQPGLVLRFGVVPTSAGLCSYLARSKPVHRILVAEHGGWSDDDHTTTWLLQAEPESVCNRLVERLAGRDTHRDPTWLGQFQAVEAAAWERMQAKMDAEPLFDASALIQGLEALPEGGRLFVGNSLSVRHLDQFARPGLRRLEVYGSRGASGIDGNVSTALGLAAADPGRPALAVMGDLTFYHDLNGLQACSRHNLNVTFLVLNNNGGGIFQRLPVQHLDPPFTEAFITPHGLTFAPAAGLYGLDYHLVNTRAELAAVLQQRFLPSAGMQRSALIEVPCSIQSDLARQKHILQTLLQGQEG